MQDYSGPASPGETDAASFRFRSRAAIRSIAAGAAALILCASVPAASAEPLRLKLNQDEIANTQVQHDFDIKKPVSVFESILRALPKKVTVYPTENYFYFNFYHQGVNFAGNIRFDAADQFDGKVHFAYTQEYVYWRPPTDPTYEKLGPDQGVKVEQLGKLEYRVSLKDVSVDFSLVDLSSVKPPEKSLRADETYIGPIWDESGIQFYLVFNKTAKTFLYVLNEQTPAVDVFEPMQWNPEISVGARTSFAFQKDKLTDRRILVGVFAGNTQLNNHFDGPFDQLPDNFIEGEALREALLEIGPWMAGKIDRYGSLADGSERYAITSYAYYDLVDDLKPIGECAQKEQEPAKYYECFNVVMPDAKGEPSKEEQTEPPKE